MDCYEWCLGDATCDEYLRAWLCCFFCPPGIASYAILRQAQRKERFNILKDSSTGQPKMNGVDEPN